MPKELKSGDYQVRYEVPSPRDRALGFWVQGFGYNRRSEQALNPRDRKLDCYAAIWIPNGRGFFQSPQTGKRRIPPGTLFWCFPGVPHSYGPEGPSWSKYWFQFNGPVADRMVDLGFLSLEEPIVEVGSEARLDDLFERLREVYVAGGPLSLPMAAGIAQQIIVLSHGIRVGLFGGRQDLITRAVAIVKAEAVRGLKPKVLAKRLHVSYPTLRRRFRRDTGVSIQSYILGVRFQKAKELLAGTSQPIHVIASRCGFADAFHFSRLFKRREAMSPSEFRSRRAVD
ncbi:MAG TPA: AraC family transcriptional regulator [Polyangiaceae bacterium]